MFRSTVVKIVEKVKAFFGIYEVYHFYIIAAIGNKELSAPSLAKQIDKVSMGDCYPSVEKLCPELTKLEEEGLVSSREGAMQCKEKDGTVRKYYRLTEEGIKLFEIYKEKFFDIVE